MQFLALNIGTVESIEYGGKIQTRTRKMTGESMMPERPYAAPESRWEAVVERNLKADGYVFYGVKTTGLYCRPGCASRLPRRENVQFFDDAQSAVQALQSGGGNRRSRA